MASKEFKVLLAGTFGSGRSTFASSMVEAKSNIKKIPAIKVDIYPIKLLTSAGPVTFDLYDSQLHAKGGLPAADFFRTADAALIFYDITKDASYEALEEWFDAVQSANSRKGSEPLPIIFVGSKLDLAKDRAVKPKDLEFLKTKGLPYLEISSKANYKTRELLLGLVRALLGKGIQLTDEIEFAKASAEVDEDAATAALKEYSDASN
ncbi:P-loop containing nucleoside triphosphate hydrolase protein [Tothia fuscella]|uniref:P-loop containing nucleoside triphosphate hydrolase protein n=1 Tax=Tothia fuscella TaxID=1048955 RepID=A0A9P4P2G0_9PEZI|nr:P-loop containing nucleoside triphosphate hydrolase protein [Tothia fuscella]